MSERAGKDVGHGRGNSPRRPRPTDKSQSHYKRGVDERPAPTRPLDPSREVRPVIEVARSLLDQVRVALFELTYEAVGVWERYQPEDAEQLPIAIAEAQAVLAYLDRFGWEATDR